MIYLLLTYRTLLVDEAQSAQKKKNLLHALAKLVRSSINPMTCLS